MGEELKQIKSKLGVYAIIGGHEYYGGYINEIIKTLEDSNINVLIDEQVKIDNGFYVIGRDDNNSSRFKVRSRRSIQELISGLDKSMPLILLNHEPNFLDEAEQSGIDLQLSGHSHNGQMFPINYITNAIFKKGYGYYRQGNLQEIVTSGLSTWGPPIRIGTKSEIVNIKVNFNR
jgi:predicted MPP superfamily phosphohydrolase